MTTWLLITYLSTGAVGSVTRVDSVVACIHRSHFAMRFDAAVAHTYCLPLSPMDQRIEA